MTQPNPDRSSVHHAPSLRRSYYSSFSPSSSILLPALPQSHCTQLSQQRSSVAISATFPSSPPLPCVFAPEGKLRKRGTCLDDLPLQTSTCLSPRRFQVALPTVLPSVDRQGNALRGSPYEQEGKRIREKALVPVRSCRTKMYVHTLNSSFFSFSLTSSSSSVKTICTTLFLFSDPRLFEIASWCEKLL